MNLIPNSVYNSLGLVVTIILQLVDRSVARLKGMLVDVLVQMVSLIFRIDLLVLNYEPHAKVPFISERPFLATLWAMINVATR